MAYDMAVVGTAYATAKSMGASNKVMLALFEAAIVESGFRNLEGGDRDSEGFLQQRPSMGWPSPRDVPTATRSFVSRAMAKESRYSSAGALAQAVQVSAFPLRYDARESEARALIARAGGGSVDVTPAKTPVSDSGDDEITGLPASMVVALERIEIGVLGLTVFAAGLWILWKRL